MRNKWLLYLVLFLLAANAALVTTLLIKDKSVFKNDIEFRHGNSNKFRGKSQAKFQEHIALELGLNEEQQQKIKAFSKEFHIKKKIYWNELSELRKEYFETVSQANPDTLALYNIAVRIGELEALKIKMEYMHYRNIRSVCTGEQAEKMDSLGRTHMNRRFKDNNSESKCRLKHSEKSHVEYK